MHCNGLDESDLQFDCIALHGSVLYGSVWGDMALLLVEILILHCNFHCFQLHGNSVLYGSEWGIRG